MSMFTIIGVHDKKSWEGSYGPMVSYVLDLEDETGFKSMDVELNRKPESREPVVGDQVVGHLENGKFGQKLKIDYEATKELNRGGSQTRSQLSSQPQGSPKGNAEPPGGWDAKEARIERQAALKLFADIIAEQGLTDKVKACVEEVERFVRQASPDTHPELPIDLSGARTEEPKSQIESEFPDSEKDLEDFRQLLSHRGVQNVEGREMLAQYFSEKLSRERRTKKLIAALQGDEWGGAIDKLIGETESYLKRKLPDDLQNNEPDESLPF